MSRPVLLLAFANDRAGSSGWLRNLDEELRALRRALRAGQDAATRGTAGEPPWVVEARPNTTLDDLLDVFQDPRWRDQVAVLHFGGHAGSYELLLETSDGAPAVAHAGGLARFLGQQRELVLVFLNGCSTQGQVRELLAAGVPAVIATTQAIDDRVATDFSARFYRGLAAGASLGRAFEEASAAARAALGEGTRAAYRTLDTADDAPDLVDARWPWELHVQPGADVVRDWSLGAAAGDPLFGLPALPERDLPPSPFRHLRWFTREHAELFFGRGAEIHTLYEAVSAPNAAPITLLYGQAGAGKSSLLDAGLRPRLDDTHDVRYARRDERAGLGGTLRRALGADDGGSLGDAWRGDERPGRPVLVILDQVEEAFTRPLKPSDGHETPKELDAFVDDLVALFLDPATRPGGRLLLGFRKEWLAEIAKRLADARLPYQEVFLDRLGRDGIREAITGPARVPRLRQQYQLRLEQEDELATMIADDLLADRASAVAPTLQVLLSKMWETPETRRGGRVVFDVDLYLRLKEQGILLTDFFDEQMRALQAWNAEVVESGIALDALQAHTTTLVTARVRTMERLRRDYAHLGPLLGELVERCCARYLLLDASAQDGAATTLAHDTLAPIVRQRFETSVLPGQRARRVLEARADEWRDGRTGERTLDATDLALVLRARRGMRAWTPDEQRLIAASEIACARESRDRRMQRVLRYVSVAALVVVATYATYAAVEARRAQRRVHALSIVSLARSEEDPLDAALLMANLDAKVEPVGGMQHATDVAELATPVWSIHAHVNRVWRAAFSPDGDRIVTASSSDGEPRLWDTSGSGEWHPLGTRRATKDLAVLDAAYGRTRDGAWIVTASSDGTARVWRERETAPAYVLAHPDTVWRVALPRVATGGAPLVATVCRDRIVRVWRLGAPGEATLLAQWKQPTLPNSIAFSPSGDSVVTTAGDGVARVWGIDGKPGATIPSRVDGRARPALWDAVFDVSGNRIATAGEDGVVRVWARDAAGRWTDSVRLVGHGGPVKRVAFSPHGRRVVSASDDMTARVWNVDGSGAPIVLTHTDWVLSAEFNPAGDRILTSSWDGKVRLWSVLDSRGSLLLQGHRAAVVAVRIASDGTRALAISADGSIFGESVETRGGPVDSARLAGTDTIRSADVSRDGQRVATASTADGKVRVWSVRPNARPLVLGAHADSVYQVAFSPDGRWVASASRDGTVGLWSADGVDAPRRLTHRAPVRAVAFSPDGRSLATGTEDHLVRVWRIDADTSSRNPIVLRGHTDSVNAVAFDATGRRVVSGSSDQTVRVWTLDTARAPAVLVGHRNPVLAVAFGPDSAVASGSSDSTVRVWDVREPGRALVLRGHTGAVRAVTFSAGGRRVASASDDRTARVWLVHWADVIDFLGRSTARACLSEQRVAVLRREGFGAAARERAEHCDALRERVDSALARR